MCSNQKSCGRPEDVGGCAEGVARIHTARDRLSSTAAIDGLERRVMLNSVTYIYPYPTISRGVDLGG